MSASSSSERTAFVYGGIGPLLFLTNADIAASGIVFGASCLPAEPPWPSKPWHCQQPCWMKAALPFSAEAAWATVAEAIAEIKSRFFAALRMTLVTGIGVLIAAASRR